MKKNLTLQGKKENRQKISNLFLKIPEFTQKKIEKTVVVCINSSGWSADTTDKNLSAEYL